MTWIWAEGLTPIPVWVQQANCEEQQRDPNAPDCLVWLDDAGRFHLFGRDFQTVEDAIRWAMRPIEISGYWLQRLAWEGDECQWYVRNAGPSMSGILLETPEGFDGGYATLEQAVEGAIQEGVQRQQDRLLRALRGARRGPPSVLRLFEVGRITVGPPANLATIVGMEGTHQAGPLTFGAAAIYTGLSLVNGVTRQEVPAPFLRYPNAEEVLTHAGVLGHVTPTRVLELEDWDRITPVWVIRVAHCLYLEEGVPWCSYHTFGDYQYLVARGRKNLDRALREIAALAMKSAKELIELGSVAEHQDARWGFARAALSDDPDDWQLAEALGDGPTLGLRTWLKTRQ